LWAGWQPSWTAIAVKEELGGEKDRGVLPVLRRTLEEKRKAR
jgi:hypothetical protein